MGTLTTVNGGEFVSQTLAACPVGSQFYVRNLFYNVPARRKFLEKSTTSTGQIKSEFQRVALCNPQVGFELLMNDQPLYRLPAASLASRIVDVVGRHIKQNLLEVDADTSIVRVTGFVGRPAAAKKSNSSEQYLFVNGRYFRSPIFQGDPEGLREGDSRCLFALLFSLPDDRPFADRRQCPSPEDRSQVR